MNWLNRFVEGLFFQPDRSKYWRAEHFGLKSQEQLIDTPNGQIYTAFLPAYDGEGFDAENAKATILYAHPCRRNLSFHLPQISWLCACGFNVFSYDPIGCGRSGKGPLTLNSIKTDAKEALRVLRKRRDINKKNIFLFGQDAGASALLYLASLYPQDIMGIIIDSVWATNNGFLMGRYGPLIGHLCTWLMPKRTDPIEYLSSITIPLALMSCQKNGIVPDSEIQKVMRAAPTQREIWYEPNTQHMQSFAQPTVCRDHFINFVDKVILQ